MFKWLKSTAVVPVVVVVVVDSAAGRDPDSLQFHTYTMSDNIPDNDLRFERNAKDVTWSDRRKTGHVFIKQPPFSEESPYLQDAMRLKSCRTLF